VTPDDKGNFKGIAIPTLPWLENDTAAADRALRDGKTVRLCPCGKPKRDCKCGTGCATDCECKRG
jgi:hypothetical protein